MGVLIAWPVSEGFEDGWQGIRKVEEPQAQNRGILLGPRCQPPAGERLSTARRLGNSPVDRWRQSLFHQPALRGRTAVSLLAQPHHWRRRAGGDDRSRPDRPSRSSMCLAGTAALAPISSVQEPARLLGVGGVCSSCTSHAAISYAGIAVSLATQASASGRGSGRFGAPTSCGNALASPA